LGPRKKANKFWEEKLECLLWRKCKVKGHFREVKIRACAIQGENWWNYESDYDGWWSRSAWLNNWDFV
jgi:hypothetical protein